MHNETFYIDGVDARSVGIQLQSHIEFSEAVPVVQAQTIPGRNGDLIFYTGSYENRGGVAACYCLQKDVEKALSAAGRFLMGKVGYRRLETSDDPNHYWLARVENSPQISMRLRHLAPFNISFDCKPQRFLKSGEDPIFIYDGDSLFNEYGQIALPLITVFYRGNVDIEIGGTTIKLYGLWYDEDLLSECLVKHGAFSIKELKDFRLEQAGVTWEQYEDSLNNCNGDATKMFNDLSAASGVSVRTLQRYIGYIDNSVQPAFDEFVESDWQYELSLDSETQNAYNEDGYKNNMIYVEDFPVFDVGETKISWVGNVLKMKIVPRWWEL